MRWSQGTTRVIVSTSAVGMGINNPSCRFTVHVQLPSSMTAFQQESGRAGRDGSVSASYLLASRSDHSIWAPILSNAARESIVRDHQNIAPPIAEFLQEVYANTTPRHRRLEEVWLVASVPLCRRWILAVGVMPPALLQKPDSCARKTTCV